MTGHLVLSTVHATDAVSAIFRLSELEVDRTIVASALIGIIGQRLVRLNCQSCMEPDFPRPIYLKSLSIEEGQQHQLRQSKGCPHCRFSGSRGRVGLYEFLEIRGPLRESMLSGTECDIRHAAWDSGLVTVAQQAVSLALAGEISVAEAYRTCDLGSE